MYLRNDIVAVITLYGILCFAPRDLYLYRSQFHHMGLGFLMMQRTGTLTAMHDIGLDI